MVCLKLGLLFLFLQGQILVSGNTPCRDVKKSGHKPDCPHWDNPTCGQRCNWYEMEPCNGICNGGMKKDTRVRNCKYDNGKDCIDIQEKLVKCKMDCRNKGTYNEVTDHCECGLDFGGPCCEQKEKACSDPVVRKGEADRSTSFKGKGNRCDAWFMPDWYRFDSPAGELMPTECVPYGSCNTGVAFWLNGSHPRPEEGVQNRTACGMQFGDCCKHKLEIKVKNCRTHMAYYLVPTQGCQKAYCIGSQERCPEGESSETGFRPNCTKEFPKIEVKQSIGHFVNKNDSNQTVHLTCSAVHPDAAKYLWKVQWFFDNEPGLTQEQDPNGDLQPKFYLPSDKWSTKMGRIATCQMQAKLRTGLGTWSRSKTKSDELYLGIKVEQKEVTVREGHLAYVSLQAMLPVTCYEKNDQCKLIISLRMLPTIRGPKCPGKPPEISQIIFAGGNLGCGYTDINVTTWSKRNRLTIRPKLDIQVDGTQTRTLQMHVLENTETPGFWHGYHLPSVKIHIQDSDQSGHSCRIVGDPQITTFDKKYYAINDKSDRKGDKQVYVAYKFPKEHEEIQTLFYHCSSGSSLFCTCGVAISAGNSSVVFDKCRRGFTLQPDFNFKLPNKTKGFDRRLRVFMHQSGSVYHVFLPTGTMVKITNRAYTYDMIVEINPSVESKGQLVGLCGNYNGASADDDECSSRDTNCQTFRNKFLVHNKASIFEGQLAKIPQSKELMDEVYCDCVGESGQHGFEDCDYHKRYEPCDDGFDLIPPEKGYSQPDFPWLINFRSPQHRNPAYSKAVASADAVYYSGSASQWTEESATKYCTTLLYSSPAVTTCLSEVPNQNYSIDIHACAMDLVLSGSTEFASAHLESVKSQCDLELKMNLELWEPRETENDSGEEDDDKKEPVVMGPPLRLLENLCPNECNGNGVCIDAKCQCQEGWGSYDCSMKEDEIPVINGVASSELPCDRSDQDCSLIALEGMQYLEGPKLTCHYYKSEKDDDKYFYSGLSESPVVTTLQANLFSLWVVQCQVPEQLSAPTNPNTTFYQMQVSVSNDGQRQSDRAYYASYNSRCEQCDGKKCDKKESSCIISSNCYGPGDLNPLNIDEACKPEVQGYSWSPACTMPAGQVSIQPDHQDCMWYYACEGKKHHHLQCPDGLAYSEKAGTCIELDKVPGCKLGA